LLLGGRQPRVVVPALVTVGALIAVVGYGLAKDRSPSTLNNIAFAALHISVLLAARGRRCGEQEPGKGCQSGAGVAVEREARRDYRADQPEAPDGDEHAHVADQDVLGEALDHVCPGRLLRCREPVHHMDQDAVSDPLQQLETRCRRPRRTRARLG
jgi:hypothetical protein